MRNALFWAITNFLTEISGQLTGLILMGKESKKILDSKIQDSWPFEDGTDRLSRNVDKKFPLHTA